MVVEHASRSYRRLLPVVVLEERMVDDVEDCSRDAFRANRRSTSLIPRKTWNFLLEVKRLTGHHAGTTGLQPTLVDAKHC